MTTLNGNRSDISLVRDSETDQTTDRPAQKPVEAKPQALVGADELAALLNKQRVERAPVPLEGGSLMPKDMDGIWRIATAYHNSGLGPRQGDEKDKPLPIADLFGILSAGYTLGLNDSQAMSSMLIVNGRPGLFGDMPLALVRKSGKLKMFREEPQPDGTWICTVQRVEDSEPIVRHFTKDMAERAGLLTKSGPWMKYRSRMYQFRSRAWALRDVFPDVLLGVAIQEEYEGVDLDERPSASGRSDEVGSEAQRRVQAARDSLAAEKQAFDEAKAAQDAAEAEKKLAGPKPGEATFSNDPLARARAIAAKYTPFSQPDNEAGGFVAWTKEMPDRMASGQTREKAEASARESAALAIVEAEGGGKPYPQPGEFKGAPKVAEADDAKPRTSAVPPKPGTRSKTS